MNFKQEIYLMLNELIDQKLEQCLSNMAALQESLMSETKSSAGDKHETGRAMIQLEIEQLGNQLAQIEKDKSMLQRINPNLKYSEIRIGSWVKTNQFNYFIGVGLGKIKLDQKDIFAISAHSPMGSLLLGKSLGQQFDFRGQQIIIEETF